MRFVFRGKSFKLDFKSLKNDWGICWSEYPRYITISNKIKDQKLLLDVLIHESLHACYPDLEERAVDNAATDIADFLWELGWRPSNSIIPKRKRKISKRKKK